MIGKRPGAIGAAGRMAAGNGTGGLEDGEYIRGKCFIGYRSAIDSGSAATSAST